MVYQIRALSTSPPPKTPVADQYAREQFKYAAACLENLIDRPQKDISVSVEGAAFWVDVARRMRQISNDGELA